MSEVLSDAVSLQMLSENIKLFPLPLSQDSIFEFFACAHSLCFYFPKYLALTPRKMIGRKKNGTGEFHVAGNGHVNTSITVSEVYLLFYICTWCILGFELTTLLNFGRDALESQVLSLNLSKENNV